MNMEKIIENKKQQLKEEKEIVEKLKEKERIELEKNNLEIVTYEISTNNKNIKIKDFLSNFDFVTNINEIYPDHSYSFEVDSEENLELLNALFDDFEKQSMKDIYSKSNSRDKSFEFINMYIDTFRWDKKSKIKALLALSVVQI